MLANGIWGGGGLGAVAVIVGVDSASGGGSASTDLLAVLALKTRQMEHYAPVVVQDVVAVDHVCSSV
jgi:hypothetical protein